MSKEDLGTVSTDDLLDALQRRYDTHVFLGCQLRSSKEYAVKRSWRGNQLLAIGILRVMERQLVESFDMDSNLEDAP